MWELIHANKLKSLILLFSMGGCLILLGALIGLTIDPDVGALLGIVIALIVWSVLLLVSYFAGETIMLSSAGAIRADPVLHTQLINIVEEMKIAANYPFMPDIYIIPATSSNAFAAGIRKNHCVIAVTAGLLTQLNRDELQGVIAHEMSHIVNRDVLFMTLAGVMLGSVTILSETFLRGIRFGVIGAGRRLAGKSKGGGAAGWIALVAILFAILAPILTQILYLATSRKREYLADASAIRLTRFPEGLASALEKIGSTYFFQTKRISSDDSKHNIGKIVAPMYIVNPLQGPAAIGLFSTHPPLDERIRILRAISHGVNLQNYQKAFSQIKGKREIIIPSTELRGIKNIPIREASLGTDLKTSVSQNVAAPMNSISQNPSVGTNNVKKNQIRAASDMIRSMNGFAFLSCACGMNLKLPPNFNADSVNCPRCNSTLKVPLVQLSIENEIANVLVNNKEQNQASKTNIIQNSPTLSYKRTSKNWETFSCNCGFHLQLSPSFNAPFVTCRGCSQKISIINS